MNAFSFLVRKLAFQAGLGRHTRYLAAANRETMRLKAIEQQLGELAWREVEDIEELTIEYWEIKDILNQREQLEQRNRTLESEIEQLERQRDELIGKISSRLEEKRGEIIDKNSEIDALGSGIEECQHELRVIEKRFEALKLKRKVLLDEGAREEEADRIYETLKELKVQYADKKQILARRNAEMEEREREAALLTEEASKIHDSIRGDTRDITEEFNQISRRVAQNRTRLGSMEMARQRVYLRIGRFLGLHQADESREPYEVCRHHQKMISKILYLRRSIDFNRRLGGEE